MTESQYQRYLTRKIGKLIPEAFVLKNDPTHIQGVPDLLILCGNMWAMLEIKLEESSKHQPNQDYYIELFDGMSFAAFINPQNERAVLDDLQHAFGIVRQARLSESK